MELAVKLEKLDRALRRFGSADKIPGAELDKASTRLVDVLYRHGLDDLRHSHRAERALASLLRAFEVPGQSLRFLAVTDKLLRAGIEHPMVVSSLAQALLDSGQSGDNGVRAALTILQAHSFEYKDFEKLWISLYLTRLGRAHKDLFDIALSGNSPWDAGAEGKAALLAYLNASQIAREAVRDPTAPPDRRYVRRMAEINVVSIGRRLLAENIDLPAPFPSSRDEALADLSNRAEDLTEWVTDSIKSNKGKNADAWDVATLIELHCWNETASAGDSDLVELLGKMDDVLNSGEQPVNTAGNIYRSLWRQLSGIVSGREARLARIRSLLGVKAFETDGASITLHRNDMDDIMAEKPENLQGAGGGGEFVMLSTIQDLGRGSASVCAMRTAEEGTIGTGFLLSIRDLLPPEYADEAGDRVVILTASHVCYWGDDAPWTYGGLGQKSVDPGTISAKFEFAHRPCVVSVVDVWTRPTKIRHWLDVSILSVPSTQSSSLPPPLEIDSLANKPRSNAPCYVVGYPRGKDMAAAMHNTHFVETDNPDYADRLVGYLAQTDNGHSGSPVFATNGAQMFVHALHFRGPDTSDYNNGQAPNFGVWLGALKKEIAGSADDILSRLNAI